MARALSDRSEADVTGLPGAARALVARGLLDRAELGLRVVLGVAADEEEADRLARDLAFFLGGRERVARLPADPVLPYDDLSPDRGLEMERLAALCRLYLESGALRAVVVSARALARRVVPRSVFDRGEILAAGVSLDREGLLRRLVELGYARVPLVEDPGTFAVRGGILDLWSPLDERPVRLEFFGDEVESLRPFEADTQRTLKWGDTTPPNPPLAPGQPDPAGPPGIEMGGPAAPPSRRIAPASPSSIEMGGPAAPPGRRIAPASPSPVGGQSPPPPPLAPERRLEVVVCPAREALFTPEGKASAVEAVRGAAERVDRPTSKVREVLDAIESGSAFFGLEALLPGFHPGGLATVFDYLPSGTLAWIDDEAAVTQALEELQADLERDHQAALGRSDLALAPEAHFLSPAQAASRLGGLPRVRSHRLWMGTGRPVAFDLGETGSLRAEIEGAHGEEGALGPLARRLEDWRTRRIAAVVACGTPSASDRLRRLLEDRRLQARVHPAPPRSLRDLYDPGVHAHLVPGDVSGGFVDAPGGLALLSDEEIFGRRVRKRPRAARGDNAFAAAFRDLEEGDLVVHVEHGIARYGGLAKMRVRGVEGDFLVLQYQGADRLYLPVSRMRQVQKFTGAGPENVRLDRLGGTSFALRKARVKEQLLKVAAELLDIYAARAAHPGFAFAPPDETYRGFEAEFAWEETPDQARAIADVIADMVKAGPDGRAQGQAEEPAPELAGGLGGQQAPPGPMDRVVCGDVGYGKTEVAMRAAMLAVMSQKQVAVLVPTTLLAAQHERTFRERFKGWPVRVEAVSRMKPPEEVRRILADAAAGKVDVLVGTHRLLASDVGFRDLGLVVVDEEQRFGVAHKERLKKLRRLVDVLTLTATPIPRTLHMGLAGVRDLSIIATPPEDRRAIRTFVVKFDPQSVKEAVEQELRRGGQVFFVHNRVRSIGAMEKFLRELLPKARIGVAHGQMPEARLEEVMARFVGRELDVLLATSIVESGLDIPSANTIIVNRADQFGLSQLYQIRGRVGRSRERAYAWLMVPARRPLTPEARKRLEALQKFSELGAGFQIASHDLEIRGAGNLLGKDQSGHIEAVGFDLYAELLEQAVRELRGAPPRAEEPDPDVQLPLPAFIPDGYVPDVHQRLYFYKRLAQAASDEELEDVRAELLDRYGEPPEEVDALSELMQLRIRLRALRVRGLEAGPGRVVLSLGPEAALDPVRLARHVQRSGGAMRLTPEMKLVARMDGAAPRPALLAVVPSPAAEAAAGRELLAAARRLVAELAAGAGQGA
ncbi:MAG TPA: TRCF domain-containing protein [Anaeromyxobacteraceae bacterium]|nr:TRCF domain-containing protein [Anaeromyxobacteraceae bacterium]